MQAERLTDVISHHGEGAGWHRAENAFLFVDMLAGDLVTVHADGAVARRHVGDVAAAWRARAGGGLAVAVERGYVLLDPDGTVAWSVEAWTDPQLRMNDGACDPLGRFWCGSTSYDFTPGAGTLWRLDPDRTVHRLRGGQTIPNGLVWSHDGTLAYHIDTPTGRIDRWTAGPDGDLGERSTLVEVTRGQPDGMTIDAEGNLWVALWRGGGVHGYSPGGELLAVVEVDAWQVTSCAFGGAAYDRLYVTTSRQRVAEGDDPAAGSVFVADVGVRGVPLREFAG